MLRFLFIIFFSVSVFADTPKEKSSDLKSEIILLFQNADGGWPKNIKWEQFKTSKDAISYLKEFSAKSTIDNNATYTEIRLLSRSYTETKNSTYRDAALLGLKFILRNQPIVVAGEGQTLTQ